MFKVYGLGSRLEQKIFKQRGRVVLHGGPFEIVGLRGLGSSSGTSDSEGCRV